jgi:hypothetical protein
MKKPLLILLGILIAVPVVLVLGAAVFIDPLVRAGVEKGASAALQVPVHLKDAAIRFSGRATLTGFEIANPPGYAEPRSVAFDRLDVAVQPGSLLRDVVEIGEIDVVKPDLTLEFAGTSSNWSVLMNRLSSKQAAPPPEEQKTPAKKFIIHHLRVQEAEARFRSDLIPGGAKSVTLPSIELENVGTAEGGMTMGQILNVLFHRLGDSALKAGQGVVPTELLNNLGSTLSEGVKTLEQLPSKSVEELQKELPDKEKVEKGAKDYLKRGRP